MSEEIEIDIDSIINRLLEVKQHKPGKFVKLSEAEVQGIIRLAKSTFL